MNEDWNEDTISTKSRIGWGVMKFAVYALIVTVLGGVAKKAYTTGYDVGYTASQETNARRDYEEFMAMLDKLTFSKEKDASKQIYGVTSINVAMSEFYQAINAELVGIESKEELEKLGYDYLKKYVAKNSSEFTEEEISFQGTDIYYKGKKLELDPDAIQVLTAILESLQNISDFSTEEEQDWIDSTVKQIMASELYEVEEVTSKKLVLDPRKPEQI